MRTAFPTHYVGPVLDGTYGSQVALHERSLMGGHLHARAATHVWLKAHYWIRLECALAVQTYGPQVSRQSVLLLRSSTPRAPNDDDLR